MSDQASAGKRRTYRFCLDVTLCDDLHTGTGLGGAGVDDLIARDRRGRPVIRWSHFKGLLVESLIERAQALGQSDAEWGRIRSRLFGDEDALGATRGTVTGRSLRVPRGAAGQADSIVVASTARRAGTRVPEDDTLRRIEYMKSGTTLAAEIRVASGATDEDLQLLRALIRRTHRLGGKRRRGAGRIQVTLTESTVAAPEALGATICPPDAASAADASVTVVLRALEPVCLAALARPGNEVPSHSHIPPGAVMGALARWAIVQGLDDLADDFFEARIVAGPGYPLPPDHDVTLPAKVDSIPIPLSMQFPKPAGQDSATPWWAAAATARVAKDSLAPAAEAQDGDATEGEKLKRPGGDDYAIRHADGHWSHFTCALAGSMRNDAGTSQRGRSKQNLFSLEEIPEDTAFVVRVRAGAEALPRLLAALEELKTQGHWISMGRAGAPVVVEAYAQSAAEPASRPEGAGSTFAIYVESDLILRDAAGRFHTRIGLGAVRALLAAAGVEPDVIKQLDPPESVSEPFVVRAWNAATGRARFAALAIRRGSVALLSFQTPQAAKVCRHALAKHGLGGLGERRREGYGRIRIGYPGSIAADDTVNGPGDPSDNAHETHLREAIALMEGRPNGFSISRWQALREAAGDRGRVESWCKRAERALERKGSVDSAATKWLQKIQGRGVAGEALRALATLEAKRARREARKSSPDGRSSN